MKHIVLAFALVLVASLAWADGAAAVRSLAEQGDAEAQFALGTMYRDGQGVTQDYAEALRWWRKAAAQGDIDAQYALGNFYSGGTGIGRDNIQAYMWYSIATANSGADWLAAIAGSNRHALVARMTPADIAEAERLAAAWMAEHAK